MKKFILLSLIGITLIAFTQPGWAAGHGGGGGGGFRGGGFRGGGGHFGGGGFGAPHMSYGGAVNRGGGVGFGMPRYSSFGAHRSYRQPVYNGRAGQLVTPAVRATTASNRSQNRFSSTRNVVGQRPAVASNRATIPSAARSSGTAAHRGLNGRTDHIFARHEANWHSDWDRRHAHFDHGHFFVFEDGFWFGLDDGFFPWDYLPYYADDYYPYDYYADVQPDDNTAPVYNDAPVADTTVQAVQTQLTQLGYYNGPVDGIFGPATRDALAKYQIAQHLSVTGSLSPDTLQSLGLPQVTSS